MSELNRPPPKPTFYFALFRLLTLLRGGDARRGENNAFEAMVAGTAIYLISYLFFTRFIPNDLRLWKTALLLGAVVFFVLLFWLVVLYFHSLIIRFLGAFGMFQAIPLRRAQSILVVIWASAMAGDLLRRGSWMAEIAAIWLIAVTMNLAAAALLALRNGDNERRK